MDRHTALMFGDTVACHIKSDPLVVNVFDPRMSDARIADLIQQIRANPVVQQEYPWLNVDDAVQEVLAERREVAGSQAICMRVPPRVGSSMRVYARHCRSGLRVRMDVDTDAAMVSCVQAKASEIAEPICPSPPPAGRCEMTGREPRIPLVLRYGGLGIGSRVYVAAASAASCHLGQAVRVTGRPSTEHSRAVRWKLHCHDPYIWQHDSCRTCARAGIDWLAASSDITFPEHERFGSDEPAYNS